MDPAIAQLRQAIDQVDQQILDLLGQRIRLVLEVGAIKREKSLQVYDPDRERKVLRALSERAPAPLERDVVERVFQFIINESRTLEERYMTQSR